jgi:uncharacterized protein YqeY
MMISKPRSQKIITETGATSQEEMGKVMGAASKQLAGKADNKKVSGSLRVYYNKLMKMISKISLLII